ncbi:SurA N-terminal domain-containing protein [Candidatus Saccharibacteria bacterium]|nr:SurA N-terminal domain-containing protein [Candidatus Saccharibacteria bacterium]
MNLPTPKKSEEEKKTEKEKIEERREEVLKSGRKFKYPLQYSKHKLVIITIAVAIIALIGSVIAGYVLLYKTQSTSDVLYRLTKVLPISVAKVDGESVRFSDYLMVYKSSVLPIEEQSGSFGEGEDAESRRNYYKRSALNEAEDYAYAQKIAREQNISVDTADIDASFDEHRKVGGTELSTESFLRIVKDNFGLSEDEYRYLLKLSLLKRNVSAAIDTTAKSTTEEIKKFLASNNDDFKKAREQFDSRAEYEETGGLVGSGNVDGGRALKALTLGKDQVSEPFISLNGDGYYIVKCTEKSGNDVSYVSLFIPFKEFDSQMKSLRESGKIQEYINISTE